MENEEATSQVLKLLVQSGHPFVDVLDPGIRSFFELFENVRIEDEDPEQDCSFIQSSSQAFVIVKPQVPPEPKKGELLLHQLPDRISSFS
jgi:hypothetical protein